MKKLLFVFNPLSGKGQIKAALFNIIDLFVKADYEVTVRPTQCEADAFNIVKDNAYSYDLIVCSGGDGTLNETVAGLMSSGSNAKIGYIPAGTTNDFASTLGMPKNLTNAAKSIILGSEFKCDMGSFNDKYFTYISAFGAFTEVAYQTSQQTKNILGHLAYVLEGMKHLSSIKIYRMRVEYDGQILEDDFVFGMISNSMSVGGFKGTGNLGVILDDGLFEVALVKMPKNAIDLQLTINDLLKLQVDSDYIYFFKASEIKITSDEYISWTLDGEFGGSVNEVTIKNIKQAITFLVDKPSQKLLSPNS